MTRSSAEDPVHEALVAEIRTGVEQKQESGKHDR